MDFSFQDSRYEAWLSSILFLLPFFFFFNPSKILKFKYGEKEKEAKQSATETVV